MLTKAVDWWREHLLNQLASIHFQWLQFVRDAFGSAGVRESRAYWDLTQTLGIPFSRWGRSALHHPTVTLTDLGVEGSGTVG